jgi:hypothetical protein
VPERAVDGRVDELFARTLRRAALDVTSDSLRDAARDVLAAWDRVESTDEVAGLDDLRAAVDRLRGALEGKAGAGGAEVDLSG